MSDEKNEKSGTGFDIVGLGKAAEAIPKEVYTEVTRGLIENFNKIISPITEITSGVGRYIRQKFDNMVELEKALAAHTLQKAIQKAESMGDILPMTNLKTFITSIDESSRETDPLLHEMWVNILASQLVNTDFHSQYVNILSNFSAREANLLMKLNSFEELGHGLEFYFGSNSDSFLNFVFRDGDVDIHEWTYSCNILLQFGLVEVGGPTSEDFYKTEDAVTVLYRTKWGDKFLSVVAE